VSGDADGRNYIGFRPGRARWLQRPWAGFLQAARDNEIEPDLVTATSGQIVVLAAYLKGAKDLKKGLIDKALEDNPFAQLQIAWRADRQVCAACDLPISCKAASATDRHECPLLMQAQRGPIYQHPPIWTVPMSPATPQP